MTHQHSSVSAWWKGSYVAALGIVSAMLACGVSRPAWAGTSGQLCIKEKIGGNPPCTANDVRISSLMATGGSITCTPGDLLNLTLTATIESGPARYDIGLWVNETGGSARSDPGGTCYRDFLTPRSSNNVGCSQMYPGPYFNGELGVPADMCGDVPAVGGVVTCGATTGPCTGGGGTCLFSTYQFTGTFECADSNNDGIADLGTCTSWDNNTNTLCVNELDTDPGTGSKCNCGNANVGNIFIDPCVSANCDDGNACTVDTCDSSGGPAVCSHTPNNALCSDGQFCNGVETCNVLTGCQAGTPPNCADSVTCTVDTCNEATDSCDHTPNNASCSNGLFCDGTETCNATLGCQPGTAPNCNDGVACTVDACNETFDTCDHTPNNGACSNGLFCDGTEICNATLGCQPGTAVNCTDGVACTVDACNEAADTCDHTPNNASCSNGLFCDGNEICNATLGCQPGTAVNCTDGVACTVDACNEATDTCDHTPNNASCSNGLFCDGNEICNATLGCQPGTPVNCTDGVACTVDACNEATDACDHTPNNLSCTDGLFCSGMETCDPVNGCEPGGDPCPGTQCDEVNDVCFGCTLDAECDNGLFCDGAETCGPGGICQPGTPPNCNDGVACTTDACNEATDTCDHTPNNGACSNGLFCDGNEICNVTLGCQPGTPVNCTDGVACTVDACNEATDSCDHTPNNASCSNGLFCDGIETCNVLTGCQPGTPVSCTDGVACTVDACNEATDSCDHTPNNASCSDGLFCDGIEICNLTLGCQPGVAPNCNDSVACTADSCNEATDQCDHAPSNAACSDSQFCTGIEICNLTLGCQPGVAPNCNDAVACTADACNETFDNCDHTPNNAPCSNGLFCDGNEICNVTLGCQPGPAVNCNDGVACTVDVCNEGNDSCDHTVTDALCDDGQYCTGIEICNLVAGCQPGTPVVCPDGVACTVDACDETLDQCLSTPSDASCSNGLFCDGTETCDPMLGCEPGTPRNCNDNEVCTTDTCDEALDQCTQTDICCGDGMLQGNEECDPPTSGEDCNNGMDDDGDGREDCHDSDCADPMNPTQGIPTCGLDCKLDMPCERIFRDPAQITFGDGGRPDRLKIHGRFKLASSVDPLAEGLLFSLVNEHGTVYRGSLAPGDLKGDGNRYAFKDRTARATGIGTRGGMGSVRVKLMAYNGEPYLSFYVIAYGNLSAATDAHMISQITVGNDMAYLDAQWTQQKNGWKLFESSLSFTATVDTASDGSSPAEE